MTVPAPGLLVLANGAGSGAGCLYTINVDQRVIGYCRNMPLMKRGQPETVVGSTNPEFFNWSNATEDVIIGGVGIAWDDQRKELIVLGWGQGTVHWFDANFGYKRSLRLSNSDGILVGDQFVDIESVRMYGPDHAIVSACDWVPPAPDNRDYTPTGNVWKIDLRTYSVVQNADMLIPYSDWRFDERGRGVDHIALSPDLSVGYFTSENASIYTFDPVTFERTGKLVDDVLPSRTTYGIRTLPDGSIVVVGEDRVHGWCTHVAPDGSILQQINMGTYGSILPFAVEVDSGNYVAYASSLTGNYPVYKVDLIAGTSKPWITVDGWRGDQVGDPYGGGLCWMPNDFGDSSAAHESGTVVFY